ncbi:hypothetical protein [Novosphingobium sp.]|uniref:hypothetical protein n=1 Tax=Novosphingobium sp. TaxID=1874826 RepID=UPI003D13D2FD
MTPIIPALTSEPHPEVRTNSPNRAEIGDSRLPAGPDWDMMDASDGGCPSGDGASLDPDGSEGDRMEPITRVDGAIVDSWVETGLSTGVGPRVVLQVAPRGKPRDLMILEAKPSLVPDRHWLEDLRENLCHGSPVAATCRLTIGGLFEALSLQLAR